MPSPRLSVVVPVYNTEKYLHRCVNSILAQTFTDFELLLIDDGSKDSSGVICDDYVARDSRVRVFHKENGGVSSARNLGLEHSQGEWIVFVDSDDWIETTMFELMYEKAVKDGTELVYCDMNMVYEDKTKRYHSAEFHKRKECLIQNYITTVWTCLVLLMVKRCVYVVNKLKMPMRIGYCEDFWAAVRLMHYAYNVSCVPVALYNYNMTNENSAMHNFTPKIETDEQTVYLETIAFFEQEGVLKHYKKQMGWRILKSKQELVLDVNRHDEFLKIYPESHNHIWDCPYINKKLKIMIWCLTHHLSWITYAMIYVRNFKENYIRR